MAYTNIDATTAGDEAPATPVEGLTENPLTLNFNPGMMSGQKFFL